MHQILTKTAVCPMRIYVALIFSQNPYGRRRTMYYDGPYLMYSTPYGNIDSQKFEKFSLLNNPII